MRVELHRLAELAVFGHIARLLPTVQQILVAAVRGVLVQLGEVTVVVYQILAVVPREIGGDAYAFPARVQAETSRPRSVTRFALQLGYRLVVVLGRRALARRGVDGGPHILAVVGIDAQQRLAIELAHVVAHGVRHQIARHGILVVAVEYLGHAVLVVREVHVQVHQPILGAHHVAAHVDVDAAVVHAADVSHTRGVARSVGVGYVHQHILGLTIVELDLRRQTILPQAGRHAHGKEFLSLPAQLGVVDGAYHQTRLVVVVVRSHESERRISVDVGITLSTVRNFELQGVERIAVGEEVLALQIPHGAQSIESGAAVARAETRRGVVTHRSVEEVFTVEVILQAAESRVEVVFAGVVRSRGSSRSVADGHHTLVGLAAAARREFVVTVLYALVTGQYIEVVLLGRSPLVVHRVGVGERVIVRRFARHRTVARTERICGRRGALNGVVPDIAAQLRLDVEVLERSD